MRFRNLVAMVVLLCLSTVAFATTKESSKVRQEAIKDRNDKCVTCHMKESRSLTKQWEHSAHEAADVGCYTCHATSKDNDFGYMHEGQFISTILSPNDCKFCHEKETKEMTNSHHATAGQIMASLDNMLAETIASMPDTIADAVSGCWQCHGSIVKLERDKFGKKIFNAEGAPKLDYKTWPNSGIGRLNPDGSRGSCNACHSKHSFDASRARQPENCGKCHLGPDHPQKEIYEESKHGIAYYASPKGEGDRGMNIYKQGKWVLGKDYFEAPTCATCHMGAYRKSNGSIVKGTHNVGDRISWTLRPPISMKLNRVIFEDGTVQDITGEKPPRVGSTQTYKDYVVKDGKLVKVLTKKVVKKVLSWKDRRSGMQQVCKTCHSTPKVENFYKQYDDLVYTYNEKFAIPGLSLVNEMKKDKIWKNSGFQTAQEDLGYIWFEIWHHEGRRARMGAAMMGPDYTHWHGLYEVARHFYSKFIPKVQKLADKAGKGEKYKKLIKEIMDRPEHEWNKTGGNPELLRAIDAENAARYGKDNK